MQFVLGCAYRYVGSLQVNLQYTLPRRKLLLVACGVKAKGPL